MIGLRLLPVVVLSGGALLLLKTTALVTNGHFALDPVSAAVAQAAPPADPAPGAGGAPAAGGAGSPDGATAPGSTERPAEVPAVEISDGERQVLQNLVARRQELDARAVELDQREALLQATEQRIEQRIAELRALESEMQASSEARKAEEGEQLQGVVTMYETMRPKDAAAIFDGMDMPVLVELASHIKPKKLADIVAQMTPANAQRLTVELTNRSSQPETPDLSQLPKIGENVGRPE